MIKNLDKNTKFSRAQDGTEYLPGCIRLNNSKNRLCEFILNRCLT